MDALRIGALVALCIYSAMLGGCASDREWYSAVDETLSLPPEVADTEPEWRVWDFADEVEGDLTREIALELLLKTEIFAGTAVGFSAAVSIQVQAFRALLDREDAAAVFREIVSRARPAGQLYGLCGLSLLDRTAFDSAVERFRESEESVRTLFGCVGGFEPIGSLVESSDPDAVRLAPGQSLTDWWATHDAAMYDIVGGAYPADFSGR